MTASTRKALLGMSKPLVALTSSIVTLVVFSVIFLNPLNPVFVLSRNTAPEAPTEHAEQPTLHQASRPCPVLLYNRQMKTGSTLISNVLYRTTEAYGCRNAPCSTQKTIMAGKAPHIGVHNGMTMTCHSRELNKDIVKFLRTAHGNNFIFVASVREGASWFRSAACFFYKNAHPELRVSASNPITDSIYRDAIDWFIDSDLFHEKETFFFESLGLNLNSTAAEIYEKFLGYDIIIDNKEVKEGLDELGKLLGWKMLEPTAAKPVAAGYRGPLIDTYRVNEIKVATRRLTLLYQKATAVREARRKRPTFAREEVARLDAGNRMQGARGRSRFYQSGKKR